MARLSRILLFPIKSMEPIEVPAARVLRTGALEHDRTLAFFDADGRFVNGKRTPLIHRLRASFDPILQTLRLSLPDSQQHGEFHIEQQRAALDQWLTEFFGFPVRVRQETAAGFPDDTDSPGPTVVSTASLRAVVSWFPGLSVEQARLRFRTNLEVEGVEPFWEDRLFAAAGQRVRFRIGDVELFGNNPCQRCSVPPRDPLTGSAYPNFLKTFREQRAATLPPWADRSRFNHFYRFAVNTVVAPDHAGKFMRVGDTVEVIGLV